jgi:peptide/nickel transport system substrate-binding protein
MASAIKRTVLCCTVLFMLAVTGVSPTVAAPANTVLRMTLVVPPNTLNEMTIASGTAGYYVAGMMLAGAAPVVFPNGTDESQSGLCKISSNSNFTTWYFTVKPGVKWSNGQDVTADDVLATFGPHFGFDPTYDFPGTHTEVASEHAANSSTAVFVLNAPDAHFLDRLRSQYFTQVYPSSFVNAGGENMTYFTGALSTGPFMLQNYTEGAFQMTLLRNPYFQVQPKISEIDVTFVDSEALTATPLLAGTTDLAPVEPSNAASILKDPNLGIVDEKGFGSSTLDYNITNYPYNMTNFRQALVYGINQSQFIQEAFAGYAQPAYNAEGVLSPVASNYYNPNIQKYSYNPSEALALLSSIGITKGSDGHLHYPNGTAASLTVWAAADNSADVIGAGVIQSNLKSLGFNVQTQTTSASNIISYYGANSNGIRNGMILYSNFIQIWGLPYLDILPGWDVYYLPTIPQPHWEYPPSVDAEYQSNATAFAQTNNPNTVRQILDNVQAINAKNLPTIVLAYPDALWGYSKQHWTNWPTNYIDLGAEQFEWAAFEGLTPLGTSTSTTSTSVSTTTTPSSTTSSSTSTTSSTSSTTSSSSGLSSSYLIGIVVVVVVILIAAYAALRRRTPNPKPPPSP